MTFSVVTTVLGPAACQDLTDLDTARDELGLANADGAQDGWIGRAIKQASAAILRYVDRPLAAELVVDTFDIERDSYPWQTPGGAASLPLTRWPVIVVLAVAQTLGAGSSRTLIEGRDFRVDQETGALLRLDASTGTVNRWEALPVAVTYAGGFGALTQEAHAIPGAAPFTLKVLAPFSCDVSVSDGGGLPLTRVIGAPAAGQYSVAAGTYTFNPADTGRALCFLYAARAVPDDLAMTCLQLITERYQSKGRDPTLVERETPGMGRERFWFGSAPGQDGPFAPEVAALLDLYKVPTVA